MATTPSFNWPTPDNTGLVKNGALDIRTLGNSIDSSMTDLKGGTTGQILAKATDTDMDFTWVTNDVGDITAVTAGTGISGGGTSGAVTITNSMATEITAKGDLIVGTGSATFDNLAAGSNGETLVADSSTSTGLRYQGSITAGKNFLINGGFDIWQRGTSFSVPAFNFPYTADRWTTFNGNAMTISQETTTVPTGANYALKVTGGATTSGYEVEQGIESVNAIRLAGKTVTASILATGTTGVTHSITVQYSTSVDPNAATGSWTGISPAGNATVTSGTFSQIKTTVAIPSTAKSLRFLITTGSLTSGQTAIFGNAQLELGSVPTEFSRAGGTIQGELAACQRYLPAIPAFSSDFAPAQCFSTTKALVTIPWQVQPRVAPTGVTVSSAGHFSLRNSSAGFQAVTALTFNNASVISGSLEATVASGIVAGNASILYNAGSGTLLFTGCEL